MKSKYLDEDKSTQSIGLMTLAGFCRNCLSKWYMSEAQERGVDVSYDKVREFVYGEPYVSWKAKYQFQATAQQLAEFDVKMTTSSK